jgi:hypothetical protein
VKWKKVLAHVLGEAVAGEPDDEADVGGLAANGALDDFAFVCGKGDLAIVGGGAGFDEGVVQVLKLDVIVSDVGDEG